MNTDIYAIDVLQSVFSAMKVQIYGKAVGQFHFINFNPGRSDQIIKALLDKDGTTLAGEKYPLAAVVMPFDEVNGDGFSEVTFPKIVFAYLTENGGVDEPVLDKYSLTGTFKTVLLPCVTEFIKRLAWSTFTNMGDPSMYPFTLREVPGQPVRKENMAEVVDVVEVLNLKATIFSQIKTCKP